MALLILTADSLLYTRSKLFFRACLFYGVGVFPAGGRGQRFPFSAFLRNGHKVSFPRFQSAFTGCFLSLPGTKLYLNIMLYVI